MKSRGMRWVENVARISANGYEPRVLVQRTQGTRRLGKTKSRWEDNFKWMLK
jgi:hypothetical protein